MYMTKIYVVRHCEAEGNDKRLFQGSTDCDITETGKKQLALLGKRFADIELDKIYTSPLIRARKTALAVRGNRDIPITVNPDLTEVHGGIVEGKPFMETIRSIPGLAEIWNEHPQDFAPEGGEPMREVYERIWRAVIKAVLENKDKAVALATHGGAIRCLNCRLNYGTVERLKDVPWCENTGITLIDFDDDLTPRVKFTNDTSHLPEELLPKHSRMAEVATK